MKDFAYSKYSLNTYWINEQRYVCSWYVQRVIWIYASDIWHLWFCYVRVVKWFMLISVQLIKKNWFFPPTKHYSCFFFFPPLRIWKLSGPIFCWFNEGPSCMYFKKWGKIYLDYKFWVHIISSSFCYIFHTTYPKWLSFNWSPKKIHLLCVKSLTPQRVEKMLLRSMLTKTCVILPLRPSQWWTGINEIINTKPTRHVAICNSFASFSPFCLYFSFTFEG